MNGEENGKEKSSFRNVCSVELENRIGCYFDEPQRTVTPGQVIVLYDENYVVMNGTIVPKVKWILGKMTEM